jgi:uncharacterized protein
VRKESLKYVLAYNTTRKLPEAAPRALQLPLDTAKIVTLIGSRRTGKPYILYESMRRLESQGVDRRQMVYLNFEDDRLLPIKTRELDLILQAHAELYPDFARNRSSGVGRRKGTKGFASAGGARRPGSQATCGNQAR